MKIVLNLANLTEAETLTLTSTVVSAMTGNAAFTPKPTLASLAALQTAAQQASNAVASARQTLALAVTNKDTAFAALRAGLTDEAATVEAAVEALPVGQQEAAILSAGMQVQAARKRLTALGAVVGLSLSAGDLAGTMDWHCDAVPHVSFYIVEYTLGPVTPTSVWVAVAPSTKSSGTLTGLPSGASVTVRVHAAGTHDVVGAPGVAGPKTAP